jgi:hypothetical protein
MKRGEEWRDNRIKEKKSLDCELWKWICSSENLEKIVNRRRGEEK